MLFANIRPSSQPAGNKVVLACELPRPPPSIHPNPRSSARREGTTLRRARRNQGVGIALRQRSACCSSGTSSCQGVLADQDAPRHQAIWTGRVLWPRSVQRLCRTGPVRESGRGCMPRTANGITCRRRIRRRHRPRACHREDGANNGKRAVFPVQGSRRPRRSWARLCRYGQSSRARQRLPGTKGATPRTGRSAPPPAQGAASTCTVSTRGRSRARRVHRAPAQVLGGEAGPVRPLR